MADLKDNITTEILKYKPVKYLITIILSLLLIVLLGSAYNHFFYRCPHKLNSRFLWGMDECLECKDTTISVLSVTKYDTVYREKIISQDKKNISPITQSSTNGKNEFNENKGVNNGIIGGTGNSIVKEKILTEKEKIDFMADLTMWEKEKNITKKCVGIDVYSGINDDGIIEQIKDVLSKHGYTFWRGIGQVMTTSPDTPTGIQFRVDSNGCISLEFGEIK